MSGEYCTTLPELAKEAAKSPSGGITGRPRALRGYLTLPDGRRYHLGDMGVMLDGYGDGLITEVDLMINAEMLVPCDDKGPRPEGGAGK